jgi:hypothetical protein
VIQRADLGDDPAEYPRLIQAILRGQGRRGVWLAFYRRLWVYEQPISYSGRTYDEGKKITWRDGLSALWCIIRYSVKD